MLGQKGGIWFNGFLKYLEKESPMGSKSPKWLIKQRRQKISDARRAARLANPGAKHLGVRRMAHHGGANKAAHTTKTS